MDSPIKLLRIGPEMETITLKGLSVFVDAQTTEKQNEGWQISFMEQAGAIWTVKLIRFLK